MAEKVTVGGEKKRAARIYERLQKAYPDATVTLDQVNPVQLMVATILAAQCTDARVNMITPDLFKKYRSCEDFVAAQREDLAADIRQCGFFNQKAASIQKSCEIILREHGGKVPGTMEELVKLPGIGRKTANVILGVYFNTQGVIVDTHVKRLSGRLGFSKNTEPDKIEQDLMRVVAEDKWTQFSHLLVAHGRAVCVARKPKCPECPVNDLCPYPKKTKPAGAPK